jgi:hypothetical protein
MRADIPIDDLSATELLEDWAWLLPKPHKLVALNNFGDMFLRNEAGEIYFFESCYRTSSEQVGGIQRRISATERGQGKSREVVLAGLLTELERAGMKIASGQCFGFKKPPSLGGEIELSNIEVSPLYPYVSLMGQIHQQMNKLPPGAKIAGVKIE